MVSKRPRLAVVVSHPIQHFAPWHREIARTGNIDLHVLFCCDWGTKAYVDRDFQREVCWDIPLLDGYSYQFLPISRRPERMSFWEVDNPAIGNVLDDFDPDIVNVFGYAYRTNWRVAHWARARHKPLLIFSDSNARSDVPVWKKLIKRPIVSHFYNHVDGALFIGDNNREFHRQFGLPDERLFPAAYPIDHQRLLRDAADREQVRRIVREKLGIPPDAFVALFCGKLSRRKCPLDLVLATHECFQHGYPIWALLVGEGAERAAIHSLCRKKSMRNVIITGFVNQSSIAEYYAASDVLTVTSHRDPHPLVVSEGASFGLPVIVSDRVGCIGRNDTARPDLNALVYRWGDHAGLRDSIVRLYTDRTLYSSMSEHSRDIGASQDALVVARQLVCAVTKLRDMGPRR